MNRNHVDGGRQCLGLTSSSSHQEYSLHGSQAEEDVLLEEEDDDDDELRTRLLPPTLLHHSSAAVSSAGADREAVGGVSSSPSYAQQSTLIYYHLDAKLELGEMAALFFNKFGNLMFYACLCIYLYGDLSIYSAAVAKTLRDLIW